MTGDPVTDTKVAITKPRVNLGLALASPFGPPVYLEEGCILNGWTSPETRNYWRWDTNNWNGNVIEQDPSFIQGYYLSQIAADQIIDSPCVDTGSDDASILGMDTYTTRTDGVGDMNTVDMGYHYRISSMSRLTVNIVDANGTVIDDELAHGYVVPNNRHFTRGTVVQLTAHPDPNYRVARWTGTDDDSVMGSTNTVTMTNDKVVTVEFELNIYHLTINVIGEHGRVEPNSGPRYGGVIELRAYPDEGYRVKAWTGTDREPYWNHNTNTVTLDSDKTVIVEFEPDATNILLVPSEYPTIEDAIEAAAKYDNKIIVSPGVHYVYDPGSPLCKLSEWH
jgi:hypothetical protein